MPSSLKGLNWGAAGLHAAAAIASALLLSPNNKSNRTVQLYTTELDADKLTPTTSRVDLPVRLSESSKVDLRNLVVAFFAFTAVSHALYATDFAGRGWYSKAVSGWGWNPFRWIEYSVSASIMVYIISVISGTKENVSALAATLITPGLMLQGFTAERELKQNALHAWSVGRGPKPTIDTSIVVSQIVPAWGFFALKWYIILSNYARLVRSAKSSAKPVDPSVTTMVYSQLAFFSVFGLIQTWQVGRWYTARPGRTEPRFEAYEAAYIAMSAITKLALAGSVVYALRD
jgi:hypothetical protein